MSRALLSQPGTCRRLMLRAKRDGDLLLAMQADAHAVLEGIRTGNARAALLPGEERAANDVAFRRLSETFRVAS